MSSDPDREAAAFFAHLFRTTMSAGGDTSDDRQTFRPIIVGVVGGGPSTDEADPPFPPDRILLVHPVSRRVSVLHGDPSIFFEMLSGGSGRKSPPPASKASIEAMRAVEVADEAEECAVCLDEFGTKAMVKEMPCKHRFHGDCIGKWLGLHGTCPVCRYSMPEEEDAGKKVGREGAAGREGAPRAVWFEITFGRGGSGEQDLGQEHLMEDQSLDDNRS